MKKLYQVLLIPFLLVICISLILILSVGGCKFKMPSAEENSGSDEARKISEQPDKELFDEYFCCVDLNLPRQIEGIDTILPHGEGTLECTFRNKKNFTFAIEVLDLKTNAFVKRCSATASSEGSDGLVMEALEWSFLRPGDYEYRIYIEDRFAAVLPFKVISYFDYFSRRCSFLLSLFI